MQLGDADTIADGRADGLLYAAADDRAQRSCAPFPGAENRYRTGTDKSTTGLGNLANGTDNLAGGTDESCYSVC